jgi:hypothetical protein
VGRAKGLADLRQTNTVKSPGDIAGTNILINVFAEAAGTNILINVFREAALAQRAGTNVAINIFKDANQQAKAQELNAILQKYYVEQ